MSANRQTVALDVVPPPLRRASAPELGFKNLPFQGEIQNKLARLSHQERVHHRPGLTGNRVPTNGKSPQSSDLRAGRHHWDDWGSFGIHHQLALYGIQIALNSVARKPKPVRKSSLLE